MNRRYEVGFSFFCGNCEEELAGLPAGMRKASGRPLCQRCAQIGEEEGWGEVGPWSRRIPQPEDKRGIVLLLFLMLITAVTLVVALAITQGGEDGP